MWRRFLYGLKGDGREKVCVAMKKDAYAPNLTKKAAPIRIVKYSLRFAV